MCTKRWGRLHVNITQGQFQALLTTIRQLLRNLDMYQELKSWGALVAS